MKKCIEHFISFFYKSLTVQSICIHNCHVRENSSVFFFTIGKAEHSAKIKFLFSEICIQSITACFLIEQIFICTSADRGSLLFCCSSAHDREYLAGQHHAYTIFFAALYRILMVIIITIEPSVSTICDPFILSDIFHHPVCFFTQISDYLINSDNHCVAADVVCTLFGVRTQKFSFFVCILI